MTVYSYPEVRPSSQHWSLVSNTAIFTSPFNLSVSTQDRDGETWSVQIAYSDLWGANLRALEALLYKLNGAQHRFTMRNWKYTRAGAGGGTPLVAGAGQTGKNLNVDGAPVSTAGWLLAGDKISVRNRLHSVDADVNTDAGGNATIPVSPRILVAPDDNAAVEIDDPVQMFVLQGDSVDIRTDSNDISSVSFTAIGTHYD